jgi:hypothetical protein
MRRSAYGYADKIQPLNEATANYTGASRQELMLVGILIKSFTI